MTDTQLAAADTEGERRLITISLSLLETVLLQKRPDRQCGSTPHSSVSAHVFVNITVIPNNCPVQNKKATFYQVKM